MARAVIVVPCYNEAERLDARRFDEFVRRHDCADLLFVNDGSRDDTEAVLALAGPKSSAFQLLKPAAEQRQAEAVRRGILAALDAQAAVHRVLGR